MKPAQSRIGTFWCRLMHAELMWPSHGQYECRTCGRRHRVSWDDPLPEVERTILSPDPTRAITVFGAALSR